MLETWARKIDPYTCPATKGDGDDCNKFWSNVKGECRSKESRVAQQHNCCHQCILFFNDTAGLSVSYKLGPRWNAVITRSDFESEAIFGFLSPNYTGKRT